jgi:hypothetical protein
MRGLSLWIGKRQLVRPSDAMKNAARNEIRGLINLKIAMHFTLLQDLNDSATMTGWRRTKRSGERKMIALYVPGICLLKYQSFLAFFRNPKFSGDLNDNQSVESLSDADI